MAGESFNPDLLLTVGADLTVLRQQLATIGRQLNIKPVNLDVTASTTVLKQMTESLAQLQEASRGAQTGLDDLRAKQEAIAKAMKNFDRDFTQAFTENRRREYKEAAASAAEIQKIQERLAASMSKDTLNEGRAWSLNERKRVADSAAAADEIQTIQERLAASMAKDTLNEGRAWAVNEQKRVAETEAAAAEIQTIQERLGASMAKDTLVEGRAWALNEQKKIAASAAAAAEIRAGQERLAASMAKDTLTEGRAWALNEQKKVEATKVAIAEIEAQQARLVALSGRAPIGSPLAARTGAQIGLLGEEAQALTDPNTLARSAQATAALRRESDELAAALRAVGGASTQTRGFLENFGDSITRHIRIIGALSIVYFGMNEAFKAFRGVIDVDHDLTILNATLLASRTATLTAKEGFELIALANQTLGVSLNQAGDDVLVLSRAFGGNAELVRAALIPSLTLAAAGGRDQAQVVNLLIGTYNLFGKTVYAQLEPAEAFKQISVDLFTVFSNSKIPLASFETALGQVAPKALSVGLSFRQTAEILGVFSQGMQDASRSGQELRLLLETLESRAPQIAKVFKLPFDVNAPLEPLKLLTQVVEKLKETGTETLEARDQIKEAFGSIRTITALETVIANFDAFKEAVSRGSSATVTFDEILNRIAASIDKAFGRLTGGISLELNRVLSAIFDVDPGRAEGITKAIDSITGAVKELGDSAAYALKIYNEIRARIGESVGLGGQILPSISDLIGHALNLLIPGGGALGALGALAGKPAPPSFPAGMVSGGELNLGAEVGVKLPIPASNLQGKLEAEMARLIELVNAERVAGDRDADMKSRLTAVDVLLTLRTKELTEAQEDYLAAVGGKGTDPIGASAKLKSALEAERHVLEERNRIIKETTSDFLSAQAKILEVQRDITKEEEKSKGLSPFGQFNKETTLELEKQKHIIDELRKTPEGRLQADLQGPVLRAQYEIARGRTGQDIGNQVLLNPQILATSRFLESLRNAQTDLITTNELLAKVGLTTIDVDTFLTRMADHFVGVLDKVILETAQLQATLGVSTDVAVRNTLALAAGATSYEDVLQRASLDEMWKRIADAIERAAGATRKLDELGLRKAIQDSSIALDDQASGYGKVGAEAEKYLIARTKMKRSYDELTPDERAEVDLLTRLTILLKDQAAIRGLVAIGIDAQRAAELALTASLEAEILANQANALKTLDTLNTFTQKARENAAEIQAALAQQNGDPFGFFLASMNAAAVKAGDFWGNLRTLAQDTAKQMSSSLSDFFFAKFTGQLTSAKDLFKAFTDSILRSIANFLAQTVVQQFLALLLGTGSAVAGTAGLGGLFGGGGSGGAGPGGAMNATGLAGGVVSGAAGAGGGLFGFSNAQLFQTGASVAGSAAGAVTGQGGLLAGLVSAPSNFSAGGSLTQSIGNVLVGQAATPILVNGVAVAIPGLTSAETIAALGEAGILTEGGAAATSGLAGAGGAIAASTVVLAAVAAAFNVYKGITGIMSNIESQRNAGYGGLAGTIAGGAIGAYLGGPAGAFLGGALGGALGDFIGGLFGSSKPELTHAQREALEANRALSAAGGFQGAIGASTTPNQLYRTLVAQSSGYVGGVAPVAIGTGVNQVMTKADFLAAIAAGDILPRTGQTPQSLADEFANYPGNTATTPQQIQAWIDKGWLKLPAGTSVDQAAQLGYLSEGLGVGKQNPMYPVLSQQGFFKAATANPQGVFASIQQGVNPDLLSTANGNLAATIEAAVININTLGAAINKALVEILAQTVIPASSKLGDQLKIQAAQFRAIMNTLIVDNIVQQNRIKAQLQSTTDPIKVLEYTAQIKALIEARYNDEITLVKKFGDALDQLAGNFLKVSASISQQINALQLSTFGSTNPLALYQTAQQTFNKAKTAFDLNPTPENAQAVQAAVDDVLKKAADVYTRPSPEFRTIFNNTIDTLQDVKGSVDRQAGDITSALAIAIGTGNSIADLTERNTAKMAADMAALRVLAEQQLVGLGFNLPGVTADPAFAAAAAAAVAAAAAAAAPGSPLLTNTTPPIPLGAAGFDQAAYDAAQAEIAWAAFQAQQQGGGGGGAQHGAWYTSGSLYRLHEGEMVLPHKVASAVRAGGGISGGESSITLMISPGAIVVNGAQDPARVSEEIMDKIEKAVRTGKLGQVIAQRVR